MEKSMSVNELMNSLPKISHRRTWVVLIDGKRIGTVSANSMMAAMDAVKEKYPNGFAELVRD